MLLPNPVLETTPTCSAPNGVAFTAEKAAAAEETPLIVRFLPSLTDLAFLMPLIFVFLKLDGARTLLGDGDTGWHVRTGEWILAHHRVPHVDLFSFSRPGAPWFAWEWVSDVCFAMLHQWGGLAAVVLAGIAAICATNMALFRLVRRKCQNGLVAIAVTLLATGACSIHWLARPHLFTLLLFVITLHITDRAAGSDATPGRTSLLVWLVPMTVLWTNLHGGFFVVFLVLACHIGSFLVNAAIEPDAKRRLQFLRSAKPWLATFVGCAAATFINPYGWGLHKHIGEYISDPYILQHISEFQGMNFHSAAVVYFEPLMVLALLTALWDARHRRFADVFLSLGWMHLALIAQRNLPLFAMAAAPLAARAIVAAIDASIDASNDGRLSGWMGRTASWFGARSANFDSTDRLWRVHLASAAPLLFVGALLLAPKPAGAKFTSAYDPAVFPERAIPVLRTPETHNIFAEDQWGDYLIYRLYPSKKVFIDGRSDFYGDKFGLQYLDLLNVKYGWEKTLDKYSIDTIAISPKFALTSTLKISRDWLVAYDDGVTVVFRRTDSGRSRLPGSLVSSDERNSRDRVIAETITRDRRIT